MSFKQRKRLIVLTPVTWQTVVDFGTRLRSGIAGTQDNVEGAAGSGHQKQKGHGSRHEGAASKSMGLCTAKECKYRLFRYTHPFFGSRRQPVKWPGQAAAVPFLVCCSTLLYFVIFKLNDSVDLKSRLLRDYRDPQLRLPSDFNDVVGPALLPNNGRSTDEEQSRQRSNPQTGDRPATVLTKVEGKLVLRREHVGNVSSIGSLSRWPKAPQARDRERKPATRRSTILGQRGNHDDLPWSGYNLMAQVRPWTSPDCKDYDIRFGSLHQFRPVALASFPCSGNTWMRRLLEQSSGFFTGSVYKDSVLQASGFYGEVAGVHDGTTIAIKTHEHGEADVAKFVNGSAILLIRNPFKAILSFHNFLFGGHTGFAPISNFFRKDWGLFLDRTGATWLRTSLNWINFCKKHKIRLHVVHYETLSAQPDSALTKALGFLALAVDAKRLDCMQNGKHAEKFKRQQGYLPLLASSGLFPPVQQNHLEEAIDYLDSVLAKEGLPGLPLHLYEFYKGAGAPSVKFVKCPAGEREQEGCTNLVEQINDALPKFKMKFRRDPSDERELEHFAKSLRDAPELGGLMNQAWKSFMPFFQDPLKSN